MNRFLQIVIAVIAVLIGYCTAAAQGELPLVREGVKWHYDFSYGSMGGQSSRTNDWLYFKGKKNIGDTIYSVCHWMVITFEKDTFFRPDMYLRQEGNKVFLRVDSLFDYYKKDIFYFANGRSFTDKESMIYDFSLNEGDEFKLLNSLPTTSVDTFNIETGQGNIKRVDSVKYVSVDGMNTKVQYINYDNVIVQGIGSIKHQIFPLPYTRNIMIGSWQDWTLIAVEDDNGSVIFNPSGVNSTFFEKAELLYENNSLRVSAEGAWTVILYGSDGREVMQRKGYGESEIPLDAVGSGMYIARLQTANSAKTVKLIR